MSQICCASGWQPPASRLAIRWWPTAAAESGASLAYLSMQQAGYNVLLYDGSYAEWMDSGFPVEI